MSDRYSASNSTTELVQKPHFSRLPRASPWEQNTFQATALAVLSANLTYSGQSVAARDGDFKFSKILDNTFLFNVVAAPLERANLKERQKDVYRRLI